MPSQIFEIIADGKKVGIVVACSREAAEEAAISATTRRTSSKMGESCDYTSIEVRPFERQGASAKTAEILPTADRLMRQLAWRAVAPTAEGRVRSQHNSGQTAAITLP